HLLSRHGIRGPILRRYHRIRLSGCPGTTHQSTPPAVLAAGGIIPAREAAVLAAEVIRTMTMKTTAAVEIAAGAAGTPPGMVLVTARETAVILPVRAATLTMTAGEIEAEAVVAAVTRAVVEAAAEIGITTTMTTTAVEIAAGVAGTPRGTVPVTARETAVI